MTATEKWAPDVAWTSLLSGTEINSLANGNAIQLGVTITNTANLDVFCDISISLASVTSGSGVPYIGLYLYPFNQDGTTYGDGRFGSSGSGPPGSNYLVANIGVPASTTGVIVGTARGIILPIGAGKFVLYNQAGVALASSGNVVKYQTYNRSVG